LRRFVGHRDPMYVFEGWWIRRGGPSKNLSVPHSLLWDAMNVPKDHGHLTMGVDPQLRGSDCLSATCRVSHSKLWGTEASSGSHDL
jgi:hypothetical protein